MSLNTQFAHGASGSVGVQGFAATASAPTTLIQLAVQEWEGTITKAEHPTSNTSVPGFTVAQTGKQTLNFTIQAKLALNAAATGYDQGHNPLGFATGPNLQADYCSINLVGGVSAEGAASVATGLTVTNQIFFCQQAIITSFKITNKEDDVISYEITGKSSGSFTINSGS